MSQLDQFDLIEVLSAVYNLEIVIMFFCVYGSTVNMLKSRLVPFSFNLLSLLNFVTHLNHSGIFITCYSNNLQFYYLLR